MEAKRLKRLPVGIQTFSEIRNYDMLYIDKTEYISKMMALSELVYTHKHLSLKEVCFIFKRNE